MARGPLVELVANFAKPVIDKVILIFFCIVVLSLLSKIFILWENVRLLL